MYSFTYRYIEELTVGRCEWLTLQNVCEVVVCGLLHPRADNRLDGNDRFRSMYVICLRPYHWIGELTAGLVGMTDDAGGM